MPLDSLGYAAPVGYVETKIVDADGEVLRLAAEIMERRGHTKHIRAGDRGHCVLGAINAALGLSDDEMNGEVFSDWPRRIAKIERRLCRRMGFGGSNPEYQAVNWNNDPHTTGTQVIARLRSAAEQGAS